LSKSNERPYVPEHVSDYPLFVSDLPLGFEFPEVKDRGSMIGCKDVPDSHEQESAAHAMNRCAYQRPPTNGGYHKRGPTIEKHQSWGRASFSQPDIAKQIVV